MNTDKTTRRAFFGKMMGFACLTISGGLASLMGCNFMGTPNRIIPVRKVPLGPLTGIAQGVTEHRDLKIALIREGESLSARSLVCTHLGCVTRKSKNGFTCSCHGSRFDMDGNVLNGPAKDPLQCVPIEVSQDGVVIADLGGMA